jgi:hypothetical protein
MGFLSIHDWVKAHLDGKVVYGQFRKIPGFASTAQWWSDLSMAAGNPPANFYASAPLVGERLSRWDSIFHGDDKAPSELYLTKALLTTSGAGMVGQFKLCDYLLYYPFIDMDSTDIQAVDNTKAIERYTDGEGVMVVAVSQAPTLGSGQFTFTYINQAGVQKTSPIQYCGTTSAPLGNIVTSQPATVAGLGPFLKLADNDTGVRSIINFTGIVANGGLCALVLVKPLIDYAVREASTPCEYEMISQRPGVVRIYDGAFLGFMAQTGATVASVPLVGQLTFVWT